ncbi:MAG: helix-turn-helix transcriptional regulator [Chloroflexi bacterium]|nr:helix-turn-helix transcriptional regulator [Chloroflexota bacterium]
MVELFRKQADMTQEKLAHKIGRSVSDLRKIEKGKKPPTETTYIAIAQALALRPSQRSELRKAFQEAQKPKENDAKEASNAAQDTGLGVHQRWYATAWAQAGRRTRALVVVVLALLASVVVGGVALVLGGSIVHNSLPVGKPLHGRLSRIVRVGDCRWDVYFDVSGFRPRAPVYFSASFTARDCKGRRYGWSWGPRLTGYADTHGRFTNPPVRHNDYGTYHYVISDGPSEINSVPILVKYDRNLRHYP